MKREDISRMEETLARFSSRSRQSLVEFRDDEMILRGFPHLPCRSDDVGLQAAAVISSGEDATRLSKIGDRVLSLQAASQAAGSLLYTSELSRRNLILCQSLDAARQRIETLQRKSKRLEKEIKDSARQPPVSPAQQPTVASSSQPAEEDIPEHLQRRMASQYFEGVEATLAWLEARGLIQPGAITVDEVVEYILQNAS